MRRQWTDAFGPGRPNEPDCRDTICRMEAGNFRIAWTEEYEAVEDACRATDILVVARRIRRTRCPNGGWIIHARATNETGAVEIDLEALAERAATSSGNGKSRLAGLSDAQLWTTAIRSLAKGPRPWTAHRYAVLSPTRPAAAGADARAK